MTFNELDKRAIEWNQIANGHRSLKERINTQIDQCNEEMCKEFFYWFGEYNKFNLKHSVKEIKTEILDGYADSRFVFIELKNLLSKIKMPIDLHYIEKQFDIVDGLARVQYYTDKPILEAYRRVIESNFSKFVKSDCMDASMALNEAFNMTSKYEISIIAESNNGYWVFRDSNGKIRKPSTFWPVDLSDLI